VGHTDADVVSTTVEGGRHGLGLEGLWTCDVTTAERCWTAARFQLRISCVGNWHRCNSGGV